MTVIRYRPNPVWHETGAADEHGRALLVAETPHNLLVRSKGRRMVLRLPWSVAYIQAATLHARDLAKQREDARKAAGGKARRRSNNVRRSAIGL